MKHILLPILVAAAFVVAPATSYSANKDRRHRDGGGRAQIHRAVRNHPASARVHRNFDGHRRIQVNQRAGNRYRAHYGNRYSGHRSYGSRGYYRDGSYYRDLDGDGHYNRKDYDDDRRHRYYGRGYYPYYRSSYYGYGGYGYGGYGYGYGYPYYYPRTSLAVSYYAQPTYAYRGYQADYGDSLAAEVQRELQRRGYYRGYVDGQIGARSRAAIRSYQADHGLTPTGRIDSRLLRSLDIG